jgi:hypothetical protein
MVRTTGRQYSGELDQFVGPGDQITAQMVGLAGWSMNWWYVASFVNMLVFAVFVLFPVTGRTHPSFGPAFWTCLAVGTLLGAYWWTRPALVVAVTRQRQVLCRRIARPLLRRTFAQAPLEAAQFTPARNGWLFAELRYRGPGTNGETVRLNVPRQYRDAVRRIIEASSGQAGT